MSANPIRLTRAATGATELFTKGSTAHMSEGMVNKRRGGEGRRRKRGKKEATEGEQ